MYVSVSVDLFSNTAASRTLKKKKRKEKQIQNWR